MGTSMSSMIQVREDLTRKPGDTVVFASVRRLVGAGVTGNQILEGNEELLNARSLGLPVGVIRHAVARRIGTSRSRSSTCSTPPAMRCRCGRWRRCGPTSSSRSRR
jgi:hypothetical protein